MQFESLRLRLWLSSEKVSLTSPQPRRRSLPTRGHLGPLLGIATRLEAIAITVGWRPSLLEWRPYYWVLVIRLTAIAFRMEAYS